MTDFLPQRIPLSIYDELLLHLDTPGSPLSLQLEVRVGEHLDEARLVAAIRKASAHHPLMRASLAPYEDSDTGYFWQIRDELASVPLRVLTCCDEESLHEARSALHSLSVPLAEAPPFRCALAHCGEQGDFFMINMNHTVCDGVGLYSFMMSILRAYMGAPDPVSSLDVIQVRERELGGERARFADHLARVSRLLSVLGSTLNPPARIAPDGQEDQGGLSFMPVRFNAEQTRRLQGLRHEGATINDVLATALHLAIEQWNQDHNQSTGRISMIMPMNTRGPAQREDVASNLSIWVNLISQADDRTDFQHLLQVLKRQTTHLKESGTMGLLVDLMHEMQGLPAWIRKVIPTLLPLTGNRIVSTAVLGNLGQARSPLAGDSSLTLKELWFSPPCRMPMGLSLGAVTLHDNLHLSFRYHRQQFSREGAWGFAEMFLDVLNRETAAGQP